MTNKQIAARIRAMPPAEPEPGWEERARQRYQESIMSIEITDCANRGKVYHNVKLLDGRRAESYATADAAGSTYHATVDTHTAILRRTVAS